MRKQNLTAYFLLYISISALFFLIGLIFGYILSPDSPVYSLFETNVVTSVLSAQGFEISTISSSFFEELKYLFFIFITTFSIKRTYFFSLVSAYKGISAGLCSALLLRAVKFGTIVMRFKIIGSIGFVIISVANICLLCYTCSQAMVYSKNIIYPTKIKSVLKRKDTLKFLINFLALVGASFLIILLNHGNLFLTVSPKGM